MKSLLWLGLFVASCVSVASAGEGPNSFSYEGRLYDDQGNPSVDPNIRFRVRIYNAPLGCVLYEEVFTKDLSATRGSFSLQLGTGTVNNSYLLSLRSAMQNDGQQHNVNGCQYTPAPGTDRKIQIAVVDSSNIVSEFADLMSVGSAAYAMSADTLQGFTPADFVRVNAPSNLTQTAIEGLLTNTGLTNLQKVANGNFTERSANGAILPSLSTSPGMPPMAGTVWYDSTTSSLKYSTGSSIVDLQSSVGAGTVTSVALSLPSSVFQVSSSPVSSSGTLTAGFTTQNVNTVFAGPNSGGAATPTFRALTAADLPANGYDTTYARLDGNVVTNTMRVGTKSAFGLSLRTNDTDRMLIDLNGNIGVGTNAPLTRLDVSGGVRIGTEMNSCAPILTGTLRNQSGNLQYCDGSGWKMLALDGSAIASLNGLTALSQGFGIGTTGTFPNWSSTGATHTLNLPSASVSGVTAGLISNTEYNSKLGKTLSQGRIWVGNASNEATEAGASGDVNFSSGGATVRGLQGSTVSTTTPADGQALRWTLTSGVGAWTPRYLNLTDIRSSVAGGFVFANTNCTSAQTLTYMSASDSYGCQSIGINWSQVTMGAQGAAKIFAGPTTGGNAVPTFRDLIASDLPAGTATQWTTSASNIYYNGGVGIGTSNPRVALEVISTGSNSAILIPSASESNRPTTPANGYIRYNTTQNAFEGYENGAWVQFANSTKSFLNGGNSFASTAVLGTNNPNSLQLKTNNTARMIISPNGYIGINTTSVPDLFAVYPPSDGSGTTGRNIVLTAQSTTNFHGGNILLNPGKDLSDVFGEGSVGIGTSNPQGTLQVTSAHEFPTIRIGHGATNSQPSLVFKNGLGEGGFYVDTAGNMTIQPFTGQAYFLDKNGSPFFNVTPSEIRINGTASGTGATFGSIFDINGTGLRSAITLPRGDTTARGSSGINGMIRYNTAGNFEVFQGGSWRDITTAPSSDARLKTSVQPITNALESIDHLRPVTFYWDHSHPHTNGLGDKREIGFIAQELETVIPEVVRFDNDGYRTVEYGKIVSLAIAAIKELKSQLGLAQNENASLKSEVERLKAESIKSKTDVDTMKAYLCGRDGDAPWCIP